MRLGAIILGGLMVGCATTHNFQSPVQSYRPYGAESNITITITGDLKQTFGGMGEASHLLKIYFDGTEVLSGSLNQHVSGDLVGSKWDGKQVSTSCSTRPVSKDWAETRCMVFIGDERTVTLTF